MTEPVTATVAATPTPLAFTEPTAIEVRGARVHNLKNLSLKVPLRQLVGIAGVSGSGKSSLALGVLYAEGSRRYLEALSTSPCASARACRACTPPSAPPPSC